MTYNTGNPIGSNDPRDFVDNAQALDRAINDPALSFTDRLGQQRMTLAGMEEAATGVPAVGASIAAQEARAAAEAARDAATVGATLYPDEATGRAAVSDGAYFKVVGAGDVAAYVYRRTSSATSVLSAAYPSAAAVAGIKSNYREKVDQIFAVSDENGNVIVEIDQPMVIKAPLTITPQSGIETDALHIVDKGDFLLSFADENGNVVLAVDADGQLVAGFGNAPIPSNHKIGGFYDYEVNHLITYGQSLSVGQAVPAISTAQNYDNLMFARGMRPQYDYDTETAAQWYAALSPAVESTSPNPTWSGTLGETPSTGAGDMVKELILSEDGISHTQQKYHILLSNPGYGAQTIAQLSKGTTAYSRMLDQIAYGLALSNAAGKAYAVQAVSWIQGESDYLSGTSRSAYIELLNTLVIDINADAKSITGQAKDIPLISYQLSSHKVNGAATPSIAMAILDVEASNPLVYISTPTYIFPHQSTSNNHLTNISSRWLGAYNGIAYKRVVIDRIDWKPLKPVSSIKQGPIAMVRFHVPHGSLTFDTTMVVENTNYGFELVDSSDSPLPISSVSITGPDTVKVIAADSIPDGAKLRYAWSGEGNVGPIVGPRGNLRDTQGETIIFDPDGINKPMHNWCLVFELTL